MSIADAIEIQPLGQPVNAAPAVPGSKSYTNRALVAAALADGTSELRGALFSDDTQYMAAALNQLGIRVQADKKAHTFLIDGAHGKIPEVDAEIFVGNAGTAARFLTACLATGAGSYRLDGVPRMRLRPMDHLFDALSKMGVDVTYHGSPGCFPATVSGKRLIPGDVELTLPGNASSQFISGLLLAAPYFGGNVDIRVDGELVSKPYLDMTASVMGAFGVQLRNDDYRLFSVARGQRYSAVNYRIEPDASAASYFFAAAALLGGKVTVDGLGSKSEQGDLGLVQILERMGARVQQTESSTTIIGSGPLHGVEVDMKDLSDVAQTLAVVAPFASSPTRVTGIGFIRHKETDRIAAVVKELKRLGVQAVEEEDGYTIHPGVPSPGRVETYDDHRMAMSFALIGLKVPGITILDPGCTSKTFPDYFDVLATLRDGPKS